MQPASAGADPGKKLLTAEKNSTLSDYIFRLGLVSTAGADADTGAYLVKIYRLPLSRECDAGSVNCKGIDLVVSVASLDLDGDTALYRITGLADWEFVGWKIYAEYDAPQYATSFTLKLSMVSGKVLTECRGTRKRGEEYVTFDVNPWNIGCVFGK